jgi:hypothetical protein
VQAAGSFQYSASLASGADRFVYGLRALARLDRKFCFLATNIKNIFGAALDLKHKILLLHLLTLAPRPLLALREFLILYTHVKVSIRENASLRRCSAFS